MMTISGRRGGVKVKRKHRNTLLDKALLSCIKVAWVLILLASIILVAASTVYLSSQEVEAAGLVDIEILSDIKAKNSSQTTTDNRFGPMVKDSTVTFTITGDTAADLTLLNGTKQAVLVIPDELVGYVASDGEASVTTTIAADLKSIVLLNTLFSTLAIFTAAVDNVVKEHSLVTIDLAPVTAAINALTNFTNLEAEFKQLPKLNPAGNLLTMDLDTSIGTLLAKKVDQLLVELMAAVDGLEAKSSSLILAGAANAALDLVKLPLTPVIPATRETIKAGGEIVNQLASGAVLSKTTIEMPTLVSTPLGLADNLNAGFKGTIVQTSVLDIDLLKTAGTNTMVYFSGETVLFNTAALPSNLDFGTHQIQSISSETYSAQTSEGLQVGKIEWTDTRVEEKSWKILVAQQTPWQSNNKEGNTLSEAELRIFGGAITKNDFSNGEQRTISNNQLILTSEGQVQTVVDFQSVTGSGYFSLNLDKFELYVPENTAKLVGDYSTVLEWTVSHTP